jgi:hypothetical protein
MAASFAARFLGTTASSSSGPSTSILSPLWTAGWIPVAIVVIYCSVSKLLLEYPALLHGRKKNRFHADPRKGMVELIAHRGSRSEGLPENTIAAFKDSVAAGAHVVELDVWLTTDGKVRLSKEVVIVLLRLSHRL